MPDLEYLTDKNGKTKAVVIPKLDSHLLVTKNEVHNIPETLLFLLENDHQVNLSEWGNLIWLEAKSHYYHKELLPPLSDKLVYSEEFKENIQDLQNEPEKIRLINIQCDKLSRYLDSNRQDNPTSLDFKPIRHSPFSDSTHECDAWHQEDAKRLFGHNLDNGKYIIDRLAQKLR